MRSSWAEVADAVVVIAWNVDHPHALAGQAQDLLDHVVVGLGPEPAGLHLPAVNDVAHEVERVALELADELQQELGLAAARAQVDIGDERRPAADGG
jgi:hypothetical protein